MLEMRQLVPVAEDAQRKMPFFVMLATQVDNSMISQMISMVSLLRIDSSLLY